ncbi:MAG TPA: signal peptidase I [Patescibacteria group bacterium]|nr:signal peptidase I [Patescibacteria group bacterium]
MEENPYYFEKRKPSFLRAGGEFILEIVKIVLISLAIIVPVRYFLIQPFYVKGASMEPNYLDKDYLIIDEASFRVLKKEPVRGEVIVFRYPKDPSQYFIKRVIGLPGETIEIKDGTITIFNTQFPSGVGLDETKYLDESIKTTTNKGSLRIELGADDYYVLGDNRNQSLDSRTFGPIHFGDIIGKTWLRGFPFDRLGVFEVPMYNF